MGRVTILASKKDRTENPAMAMRTRGHVCETS